MTIRCQLINQEDDVGNYVIYVFKVLEGPKEFGRRYVMVTRWPNWIHRDLDLGEIGFLEYREVHAGVDTWYDGTTFIPYNYTNNVFIRFVKEQDKKSKDITI